MTQNLEQLIEETMQSYYEYLVKIEGGCGIIAKAFQTDDLATVIQGIQALSEGLSWMIEAENLLQLHSYRITSPVSNIMPLFKKINVALEAENFPEVGIIFEDELKPLFNKVSEWKFEEVIS